MFDAGFRPISASNTHILLSAMKKSTRPAKSVTRLLFPVVLLVLSATAGSAIWLVYTTARPLLADEALRDLRNGRCTDY